MSAFFSAFGSWLGSFFSMLNFPVEEGSSVTFLSIVVALLILTFFVSLFVRRDN